MDLSEYFHVLNPSSFRRDAVRDYFRKNPALRTAWIERQSHPTHLETVLNWTQVEGHAKVAIWGGDGTINRVLQFFYENGGLDKVTLALFPAGTCNDFYRRVSKMERVGEAAFFDLGLLETEEVCRVFLNNAGFGRSEQALRRKKANPILDILSLEPKKLNLAWNEGARSKTESRNALLGVVCNSPYFNCGLHFQKDVNPQDGFLDGFFEEPQFKPGLLWKFIKGRRGAPMATRRTFCVRSPKIQVSSDQDLFPQVDGESVGSKAVHSVSFSIAPKKLQLVLGEKLV